MRLIMMSTGPFGVPAFRGLYDTCHNVVALVTRPVRPAHSRKSKPVGSPTRQIALQHGTPIFDPEDVNSPSSRAQLAKYQADLMVVCDYGQILSRDTLHTTPKGGINIHGSLLPRYRGAAPVNWAIYHGEVETGVSIIHMTPKLDAGPVIAQGHTLIGEDETAEELEARLAEIGAWLLHRTLDDVEAGRIQALPQDPTVASTARRLCKSDGLIDWNRPARAIKNHVRAVQPWPKAYTFWHRDGGQPMRLILDQLVALDEPTPANPPGTVLEASGSRLCVATIDAAVQIRRLQPAGKRMLTAEQFLRGYRVRPGQKFGNV